MITRIDDLLDRVTMYRLVLYVLIGLVAIAAVLSYLTLLPFSPLALLLSTLFLVVMCWAANSLLARIFAAPTNVESAYITALILALIIDPAKSPNDLLFLGWAAILATSSKYILSLKNKSKMASDIVDFVFRPAQRLVFEPGQYMEFTLAHVKPDSRGNRRFFTLASSPTEENLHLGVRFYANSSSFKKALYRIDGRAKIMAGQIAGDFTLPGDPRQKLVFIAGGIGITPFRSMLKYLLDMNQRRDIVLLYANRTADEIAYKDILGEGQTKLGIKAFYTLTNTKAIPRNWRGLVGRIDEHMIQAVVPDYEERTFYLSGSLDMVRAYEHILKNMHIKKDFFPGLV